MLLHQQVLDHHWADTKPPDRPNPAAVISGWSFVVMSRFFSGTDRIVLQHTHHPKPQYLPLVGRGGQVCWRTELPPMPVCNVFVVMSLPVRREGTCHMKLRYPFLLSPETRVEEGPSNKAAMGMPAVAEVGRSRLVFSRMQLLVGGNAGTHRAEMTTEDEDRSSDLNDWGVRLPQSSQHSSQSCARGGNSVLQMVLRRVKEQGTSDSVPLPSKFAIPSSKLCS